MNRMNAVLLLSLVVVVFGCTSTPTRDIRVDAQADPKANFSGYQSYAWLGSAAILNDPHGKWEPPAFDADAEVRFLIDRELRKRGMMETSSSPDLIVAYAAGIDMAALELKTDPESKISDLTNVPKGGLAIGLVDARTGFVIWMGKAIADIQDDPDAATAGARLDYAVTEMIKRLPE